MSEDQMRNKYMKHFSSLLNIDMHVFDVQSRAFSDFDSTFCSHCPKQCDYRTTHLYGCYESARWDGKYIYFCQMDFIFVAVPLEEEFDVVSGGVIAGPILTGALEDYPQTYGLPHMKTTRVNDMAEVMAAVFMPETRSETHTNTARLMNTLFDETHTRSKNYPIELEKQLKSAIVSGDVRMARDCLNRLLGDIFFQSNADLSVIRTRADDLLVLLSHAAIEGGAYATLIFALTSDYRAELGQFDNLEKLSIWLGSVLNRLVSYVFDFADVQHQDTLRKIIRYIKENYNEKITLDDLGEHVFMSKYYISRMFNEQMKMSVSAFINKVRINHSKALLLDTSLPIATVAGMSGFEDQSYFTRQFRQMVGCSPGKYREQQGKEL